jgi:hypothetical protein
VKVRFGRIAMMSKRKERFAVNVMKEIGERPRWRTTSRQSKEADNEGREREREREMEMTRERTKEKSLSVDDELK